MNESLEQSFRRIELGLDGINQSLIELEHKILDVLNNIQEGNPIEMLDQARALQEARANLLDEAVALVEGEQA